MIKRRGTLFVVSAPSGAGKTTLCREIRLRLHDIAYSVSVTTRPPRPGEIDGTDFRFVREPQFRAMLDRGELAEWATVHGNLYGTPAKPLETALADGSRHPARHRHPGRRPAPRPLPGGGAGLHRGALDGRARAAAARAPPDGESEIARRLARARDEVALWRRYDYLIVNRDVKEAIDQLEAIVHAERCRVSRLALNFPIWRYTN